MGKPKVRPNKKRDDEIRRFNTEAFNKIITTITATYAPGLFYLINQKTILESLSVTHLCLLKVSAAMIMVTLVCTLIALYIGAENIHQPCKDKLIDFFDIIGLVFFVVSIFILILGLLL